MGQVETRVISRKEDFESLFGRFKKVLAGTLCDAE